MWSRHTRMPAALALAMLLPTAALAATTEEQIEHLKQENAQMKEMLMQMQEQLQNVMMKTNAMAQQAKAAAKDGKGKKGMVASKKENITISTTGGGIKVKSSNGNKFKIGGRLMFDHDSYDEFWNGDDTGSAEENEIRRSRVTLAGQNGKHWSYKFTANIDHEDEGATVDTGFLKYSNKPMYVKVGKYKRPAMLEERTSSKWISTVERSIVNELSGAVVGKPSFGGVEVGFATKGDMPVSGALGVYDDEMDEDDGSDIYGVGARLAIAPQLGDNSFLHAGASFYTADFKGENHRMRSRMGVHTTGRPFETNSMASDDIDQMGAELAYVNGPFSLQGEFMNVESDGTDNGGCGAYTFTGNAGDENQENKYESGGNTCDLEMDGFYVQAAYTLTGETRGYKASSGEFKTIKPKDEMGAWELVARYEDADIDVPGRGLNADLERLVLGVNWYVNKNVKLMVNYVDSEADCSGSTVKATDGSPPDQTIDASALLSKDWSIKRCGYNKEDDGDAISLRAQYVF